MLSLVLAVRIAVVAYGPRPGPRQLAAQVRFLDAAIQGGAGPRMQQLFPEGSFFLTALTASAATAVPDPDLTRVRQWRDQLDAPATVAVFGSGMVPEHGIFQAGWSLAVAVDLATVSADPADRADVSPAGAGRGQPRCAPARRASSRATRGSTGRATRWSPPRRWPGPRCCWTGPTGWRPYGSGVRRSAPRSTPRPACSPTGSTAPAGLWRVRGGRRRPSSRPSGPRSASRWTAPSTAPDWDRFRAQFVVREAGLVGVREFPRDDDGAGDVDSGPLILGVSTSASVVTLAAAREVGDTEVASALDREAELLGLPISWGADRRYALGVLPVGDAFLAWARSRRGRRIRAVAGPGTRPLWPVFIGLALLPARGRRCAVRPAPSAVRRTIVRVTRRLVEIESLAAFDRHSARARTLNGWFVRSVDLSERSARLAQVDPRGAVFLGCLFAPGDEEALRTRGGLSSHGCPTCPSTPTAADCTTPTSSTAPATMPPAPTRRSTPGPGPRCRGPYATNWR